MMRNIFILFAVITLLNCQKKDQLADMNNVQMPLYEELNHKSNSTDTLRVLILGNSIASHGIANNIGWRHKSGMAASEESKDYIHLLFDRLITLYPTKNIFLRYSNWSQLERSPDTFSGFNAAIDFNPNILIFQLSDNISPESSESFSNHSIEFLKKFDNKYVVSPFFMNSSNYRVSQKIASESNSTFIDISYISKNKLNKASNDQRSDKSEWRSEGIGEHPGNTGMFNISESIFKALKR